MGIPLIYSIYVDFFVGAGDPENREGGVNPPRPRHCEQRVLYAVLYIQNATEINREGLDA